MLQTEGFHVITQVDPNMVIKKNNKNDDDDEVTEVQDGWKGHILPFELVQEKYTPNDVIAIKQLEDRLLAISSEYMEIIDSFEEDEKQGNFLNESNDAFVSKELKAACDEILQDIESDEINALIEYLKISKKKEKVEYVKNCKLVNWDNIEKGADGTCKKAAINSRIQELKMEYEFSEESFDGKLIAAFRLMDEEGNIKRELKQKREELHLKTKEIIEGLSEEEALKIVELKWINPLINELHDISNSIIEEAANQIDCLAQKYATTMHDIQTEKNEVRFNLCDMVNKLIATGSDKEGLDEFKLILGGQNS